MKSTCGIDGAAMVRVRCDEAVMLAFSQHEARGQLTWGGCALPQATVKVAVGP